MKKIQGIFLLVILITITALTSYYLTNHMMHTAPSLNAADTHMWIHKQLAITEDQEKNLEICEKSFSEKKKHYAEVIRLANMELAQAILEDKGYSPRVIMAVEKIHEAQGELQKATLEHVFEMKQVLTPEQYSKLLELTADALYQIEHER